MADSDEDLKLYVNQQLCRPSYSRMLSAELTRSPRSKQQRQRQRKQSSKRKAGSDESHSSSSGDDINNSSSDNDSVYLSAEEEPSVSPIQSSTVSTSSDCFGDSTLVQAELLKPSRRRRKSSRQKKNVKHRFQCEVKHLMNINFDDESDTSSTAAYGVVPSLMSLCRKCLKHIQFSPSIGTACGINKLLGRDTLKQDIFALRTKYLYSIFRYYEVALWYEVNRKVPSPKSGITLHFFTKKRSPRYYLYTYFAPEKELYHHRFSATIWHNQIYNKHHDDAYGDFLQECGQRGTNVLPLTSSTVFSDDSAFRKGNSYSVLLALCSFLDDAVSPIPVRDAHSTSDIDINQQTNFWKHYLAKKFPVLIKYFFDEAIPYMWWSHGNIAMAEKTFLAVIKNHGHVRHQALYYNELGRLFLLANNDAMARHYFRKSADRAVEQENDMTDAAAMQIDMQAKMLAAHTYDVGLLSSKSVSAHKLWNEICIHRTVNVATIHAAATSLLLVHCGYQLENDTDWISSCLKFLQSHQAMVSTLNCHIALLSAMKGSELDCELAAQSFIHGTSGSYRFIHYLSDEDSQEFTHPFGSLLQQVSETKTQVKPMRLLWRTHPLHPIVKKQGSDLLGDFYYQEKQHLWFDSDGNLATNAGIYLPTIPQLTFDPFTGALQYKHSQG